ncbi:hypothetical protein Ahy_A06g028959 [Arachis hypogaea]|uniref:DUF4283 domain-containing protein n=1 Tax=Arachis hypogaea TaxID=3818 RepID=A0A445CRY9_ARAHY|nr:hypothetical protein Ahy_A06g028959 [Arachis hypogaea]
MHHEHSPRVSKQEDDLVQRSTKKVKIRREGDIDEMSLCMEIVSTEENAPTVSKGSYKKILLTSPDLIGDHEFSDSMKDDEHNPEDRWYNKDDDPDIEDRPFNPCPTISVSKEEFEEWCQPWKNALMVKVLGKRVTFAYMEQRLRRDWENKDSQSSETPNENVDAKNGKAENPPNPHNHDNGQINPDFGPWMLVKRYNFKKKAQSGVRKSLTNQGLGTNNNSEEGNSPKGKDPGAGSRFAILHEEGINNVHERVTHMEANQEAQLTNGLKHQAHKVDGKTQIVQKRVMKVGAGKNPQPSSKAGPGARGGAELGGKGNNNKGKAIVPEKFFNHP